MRNEGRQLEAGFVDRDPRETICLLSDGAEAEPKAAVADKEGGEALIRTESVAKRKRGACEKM